MKFPVFSTPSERCALHPSGWAQLEIRGVKVEVTKLPLLDTSCATTFARPTYRAALDVARREGARLLTTEIVDAVSAHGFYLDPVIVRENSTERADRAARGGKNPLERMASLEWARRHDAAIIAILRAWEGHSPVANAGKDWIEGAPTGRALNYGWDRDPRPEVIDLWQTLGTRHDDLHTDYSQTLRLWRPLETPEDGWAEEITAALWRKARAFGVLLFSSQPSHGYRCSVAELVADARALGFWREGCEDPRVGDLLVSARQGGDPTLGGPGHVERVCSVDPLVTVGGNENDRWVQAPFDLRDKSYRGAIRVAPSIGVGAVHLALQELASDVKEAPGPANNPRIQEYHAGARRGGSPVAGMPDAQHEGALVLGAKAPDSVPWCASAASWCTVGALA